MSIANELSSDVATAVLTRQQEKAEIEAGALLKIVLEVHSTLQRLTLEARQRRRLRTSPTPADTRAASATLP